MKQWHITLKDKNNPATINGVLHENIASNKKRAIGGPMMKAKPRERLLIPRHLISLLKSLILMIRHTTFSTSKTLEMTTCVSASKAPEKNKIIYKKNKS